MTVTPSVPPLRRHLIANVAALAPSLATLAGMAWVGWLAPGHAAIAAAAIAFVTAILVRRYLASFTLFARHVDALASGGDPDTPRFAFSPAADELAASVGSLSTMWREQRRSMEGLAASAQTVVDGLPDPLLAVDRRRRVVRWNRAAAELLGGLENGQDFAAVLRQPALLAAVDAALADGADTGLAAVEIDLVGPPQRVQAAHVRRLHRATEDGSLVLVVLHDITALRRAERMRADFVANASHELRTPLASLVGFVETLRGPARDDEVARDRFLAIMAHQADRMRRVIEDLLSLSRIEQREHEAPTETVDLVPVLGGIVELLEMKAATRGVSLALALPATLPVIGDHDELTIVFQNLIDNAIKYTDEGSVSVVLTRQKGQLVFVVSDTGPGVPDEYKDKVLERLFRLEQSRTSPGSGLGLALVAAVAKSHGLELKLEDSSPGLKVCLRFPPSAESQDPRLAGAAVKSLPAPGKKQPETEAAAA